MKTILSAILMLFFTTSIFAQLNESEKIDWENLKTYTAKSFVFKSDKITYSCNDCRYVEVSSNSGVSGYYIMGESTYAVDYKKMEGKSMAIMIRMNPKDAKEFLTISSSKETNDVGFNSLSLLVLNNIFKRCYHSGMDALIPMSGEYTLDLFSEKEGDLMISYADKKINVFSISKKRNQ
jgi:hypothetical protein